MANCNDCSNLDVIIETDDTGRHNNHVCTRHGISVRYTAKRFLGYIWPCVECNGDDFEKK